MSVSNIKTQMNHLSLGGIKQHTRSSSSPPTGSVLATLVANEKAASSSSTSSSSTTSPNSLQSPTPLSPNDNNKGTIANKILDKYKQTEGAKSSFEQLRDQLGGYEFDGEVIIKDVSSDDEEYEYDYDEDDDSEEDGANKSNDSSIEEDAEVVVKGRGITVSGEQHLLKVTVRHDRSESTIIHPDPPKNTRSATISSPNNPVYRQNDKSSVVKEAISSEYKKMMDNPDEFRAEKLKQRKSKFFTKEELVPFNPSSGTLMKSKFYKQFMQEKITAMSDNVDKYKSDLIKNYILELTTNRNSGPISFGNVKPASPTSSGAKPKEAAKDKAKVGARNRSYSQPPETSPVNKPLSGMTLESVITRENNRDGTNRKIPLVITKCIDYLSNETALNTEGLFRVTGNQAEVETLMKSLLQHGFDIPTELCVHVVTSTLKKFLRQLQVPVFTFKYHHEFFNRMKIENEYERNISLKKLIAELPDYNQRVITIVIRFLGEVQKHSASNMMHAHNLGLMFGPTMMKAPDENDMSIMLDTSNQIITYLIENVDIIFKDFAI